MKTLLDNMSHRSEPINADCPLGLIGGNLWKTSVKGIAVLAVCLLVSLSASAASISEPATTFYGKVLGTADLQPFLITDGRLTWVIRRADGVDVTLRSSLFAYNGGAFSYRLDVPHSALALGLSATTSSVPLSLTEQTHQHLSVSLDGAPVTLLGPAGSSFTTAQLLRLTTYRLDLGVNRKATDTDGDGLPDWWEDLYGLDKQANDANLVFGVGGLTAAQAYARGLDPNADHTVPVLKTAEKIVYAGGNTALILDAADIDTAPSNLVFTVNALPFGSCGFLAADGAWGLLEVGSRFTQDDVRHARLIYQHGAEVTDPGVIGLALSDGQHEPVEASVRLLLYEPALNEVSQRSDLYQYANAGFIVAEGDSVDASAADQAYVLVGADVSGGLLDDVIYCGLGNPARATGGTGADRFVVTDFATNSIEITDFSLMEGDVLDLSQLPVTDGTPLSAAFSLSAVAGGFQLMHAGGAVKLDNLSVAQADLSTLVEQGSVRVPDGVVLETRVSVAATVPIASRNGPVDGVFTVTRSGCSEQEILVNLLITGSAVNGSDYCYIPNSVRIPAGATAVNIAVTPYVLSGALAKVVALTLAAGPGYALGAVQQASVTIEPLKPRVYVDVFEPLAVVESGEPGYFILWRDGVADTSLIVKLAAGGSAVKNVDYVPISTALTLTAGEDERLIAVTPMATATFPDGPKKITLSVLPSTTGKYLVGSLSPAEVTLVERYDTFEDWLARQAGGFSALTAGAFDERKSDADLFRLYAFGANADGSGVEGLPRPLMIGGQLVVKVKQPFWLSDVAYSVRGFTDLAQPEATAAPWIETEPPPGEPSGAEWRYYRLDAAGPRGFISVDVKSF